MDEPKTPRTSLGRWFLEWIKSIAVAIPLPWSSPRSESGLVRSSPVHSDRRPAWAWRTT